MSVDRCFDHAFVTLSLAFFLPRELVSSNTVIVWWSLGTEICVDVSIPHSDYFFRKKI